MDETEFPPALWRRSGRPLRGQIIRAYVVVTAIAGALLFLSSPISWVVCGVAVALGLAVPPAVELYLRGWERRVQQSDKRSANSVLEQLRSNRWIRNLAPHGWTILQEGVLQMRREDGRAAASCFEQALRLAGSAPSTHVLVSARAHALVLAGDRRPARELLEGLAEKDELVARDHLDLGLVLLQESGRNREALEQLEKAREDLPDHPRVLAGLALARKKTGAEDPAYEAYLAAAARLEEVEDAAAAELLKRARKALRERIKREQKQARVEDSSDATSGGDAVREATNEPSRRRDKRKKRDKKRDKRKNKKGKRGRAAAQESARPVEKVAASPAPNKAAASKLSPPAPKAPPKPAVVSPPAIASPIASPRPTPVAPPVADPKPAPPAGQPPTPARAPLFAPPGAKPAAAGAPLFAPPSAKKIGAVPPILPPPPIVGPAPKLGSPPLVTPTSKPKPVAEDDGWGDALDAPVKPPSLAPKK